MIQLTITIRVLPIDFLDTIDRKITEVDEIDIISTSDLKDINFSHYMDQSKSMLCRKIVKNFMEEDFGDFDYNWLPGFFKNINV